MPLRRMNEHVKSQNWLAVFLDFVVVLSGVFLGIQFSNWNDARQQRAQEALYLERLSQDFDLIIDRLELGLDATRTSVESGQLLLDYIEASETGQDEPSREEATAALGRIGTSAAPAGPSATFTEMVSSGDLSIIRDDTLRDALFEYDLIATGNRESWRVLRRTIVEEQRTIFSYFEAEFDVDPEQISMQVTGFDEVGFLADEGVPPAIGIISGVSINENQLMQQQHVAARQVRDRIAGAGGD